MRRRFQPTGFWGLFARSEGHPWPVPRSSMALVTDKQTPKPSPGIHREILEIRRQVGMAFSRHAVNTSLYAHRQPSLAGDVLENAMPTCRGIQWWFLVDMQVRKQWVKSY